MNRVLRSMKIEDLRDPQLETFKRTIMTEVNKVLPEPLIQGIVVGHLSIKRVASPAAGAATPAATGAGK